MRTIIRILYSCSDRIELLLDNYSTMILKPCIINNKIGGIFLFPYFDFFDIYYKRIVGFCRDKGPDKKYPVVYYLVLKNNDLIEKYPLSLTSLDLQDVWMEIQVE